MSEATTSTTPAPALFAGLTVIEYAESPAISFATRLLADLGADVLKVEPPGGDPTRLEGFVPQGADASALFAYVNAGKRSVVIDTSTGGGAAELRRLIEGADIVVDGHAPAHWEELGIDFDALPGSGRCRLAVSLTPFGRFGERAEWAANHLTVHHAGGEAHAFPGGVSYLKYPDREPLRAPGVVGELDAGQCTAVAMLGWLRGDREPAVLELSMQETAMALSRQDIVKFPNDGFSDTRATRAIPVLGQVECRDGWMEIYPTEQAQWERLVAAIGRPSWAEELGKTADDRIKNTGELNDLFAVWLLERTKAEIYPVLRDASVPAGPVRTPQEILDCEQMRYRGLFATLQLPGGETVDAPAHPYIVREAGGASWRPTASADGAPALTSGSVHGSDRPAPPRGARPTSPPDYRRLGWLDGTRVIDLTWYQAGPYCNSILASLGAEVIKIESLTRTDPFRRSRRMKSVMLEELKEGNWLNTGYRFNEVNLGKRGAQINLKEERGRELLRELVAGADVVIESFRAGTMERLGLSFDVLREMNPRLVMLSLSANGSGGPDGHLSGYAAVFGATSGLAAISGYDASTPSEYRGPLDQRVGTAAAFATMVGLAARDHADTAIHIDFAASEVGVGLIGDQLIEQQLRGCTDYPLANHHPLHAPHNCYEARLADRPGWVSLAAETDEQWRDLVALVGSPMLDASWDRRARKTHEADIDTTLAAWVAEQNRDELVIELQARGIPSAPTMSAQDFWEDAHQHTRGMWAKAQHPEMGEMDVLSMPWMVNGARPELSAAPIVGQDNDYVYGDLLGLSPEEQAGLIADGVLR